MGDTLAKRSSLSKTIRFEVFKRDSFTCQYCGQSAPDVILHVDHIHPVAAGGTNEIINLITSCAGCNSGKGKRKLDDSTVVKKQIDQLKEINERAEQLKMMAEWRNQLMDLDEQKVRTIADLINRELDPANREISDSFRKEVRAMLKIYSVEEIWTAVELSSARYLTDVHSQEHRNTFLEKISRICYWRKRERENPIEAELRKMAYTANRLWWSCKPKSLCHRLIYLHEKEHVPKDVIFKGITSAKGITAFENYIQEYFDSFDEMGGVDG